MSLTTSSRRHFLRHVVRVAGALSLLAVVALAGACDDDSSGPRSIDGSYSLVRVQNSTGFDDNASPFVLPPNESFTQITSAQLSISGGATQFAITIMARPKGQSVDVPVTGSGTVVRSGNALSFSGTIGGTTVTVPATVTSSGSVTATLPFAGGFYVFTFTK